MAQVSESYSPGELIFSNEPFAYVVDCDLKSGICDFCWKRGSRLKLCSSCNYVRYCDKKCQKGAWSDHKAECKRLAFLLPAKATFIRLVGKVIFKLKTKVGESFVDVVGTYNRKFADLISHFNDMVNDDLEFLHLTETLALLKAYLGSEHMPHDPEAMDIIGKVFHNRFSVGGNYSVVGSALYIGASIFDHSCIPNAVRSFNGKTIEIRALESIKRGDMKLVNISYFPIVDGNDESEHVFKSFYSKCICQDCSLPYGESVLTKIIDEEKAYDVIMNTVDLLHLLYYNKNNDDLPFLRLRIDDILKKQDGVLGNTNRLRLRTMAFKIFFSKYNPSIIVQQGTSLVRYLTLAFGERSPELLWLYDILCLAHLMLNQKITAIAYEQKKEELHKLHGTRSKISLLSELNLSDMPLIG